MLLRRRDRRPPEQLRRADLLEPPVDEEERSIPDSSSSEGSLVETAEDDEVSRQLRPPDRRLRLRLRRPMDVEEASNAPRQVQRRNGRRI